MALEFSDNFDRQALLQELGRTPTSRTGAPPVDRVYAGGSPTFDETGRRPSAPGPAPAPAMPTQSTGYGQYRGALEGFDHGKMDAGHSSPKYVYAKYASHYTPQQLASDANVRAELAQRLKDDPSGFFSGGVDFVGNKFDRLKVNGPLHDKFEGISEFDVIRAAGEGGKGHQWGAITGGVGNAGGAARGVARAVSRVPQDQGSAYERIMALIRAQQSGDNGQTMDDEALRRILGTGAL